MAVRKGALRRNNVIKYRIVRKKCITSLCEGLISSVLDSTKKLTTIHAAKKKGVLKLRSGCDFWGLYNVKISQRQQAYQISVWSHEAVVCELYRDEAMKMSD